MDKSHVYKKRKALVILFAALGLVLVAGGEVRKARAQSNPSAPLSDSQLVAEFRRVEVASVSDAIEQLTGKRMYMTHHMQPIFTAGHGASSERISTVKDPSTGRMRKSFCNLCRTAGRLAQQSQWPLCRGIRWWNCFASLLLLTNSTAGELPWDSI